MNDTLTRPFEISKQWGHYLNSRNWNYMMTVTFKHDITKRRNELLMIELDKYLMKIKLDKMIFWVIEHTSNNYQTHCHFLIKGKGIEKAVFEFYNSRRLINPKFVLTEIFNKNEGGAFYVSKYLHRNNVEYGII